MTDYNPLPRHESRKMRWLLTNGTIVEEPPLEQSAEGRRVRVMGSTKSVYKKELDDLIYRSVSQYADRQGEKLWKRIDNLDPVTELDNHFGTSKAATPHLLAPKTGSNYYGRSSELSWTFRHEDLPIAARLRVTMTETPRNREAPQSVEVKLEYASTNPVDAYDTAWLEVNSPDGWSYSVHSDGSQEYADGHQRFRELIRDDLPQWAEDVLGERFYKNEREAAAGIAKLCRTIESYESITIPDLRDPEEPQWLELGLYDTTFTQDFARALIDFINGQPVAEELAELWGRMVETFRRAGIVVSSLEESDFASAIQGETDRVEVTTTSTYAPDGPEQQHIVGFNLATGTVTVVCQMRDTNPHDVATDYEIARIRAEARGELEAFLGHQAGFLEHQHDKTFNRIVEERSVEVDDLDELLGISQ